MLGIRTAEFGPALVLKDEPVNELDCSGDFKAASDIRLSGPTAGAAMYCGRSQRSRSAGTGCRIAAVQSDRLRSRTGLAGAAGLEPGLPGTGRIRHVFRYHDFANATIMNTMIVVIVVSRRVGQVTLAVSERTSCKNLNGLTAIV